MGGHRTKATDSGASRRRARIVDRIRCRLQADRPAHLALFGYVAVGLAIALALEGPTPETWRHLAVCVLNPAAFLPLLILPFAMALLIVGHRGGGLVAALRSALSAARVHGLVGAAVLLVGVGLAGNTYSVLKRLMPHGGGFTYDPMLADLDAWLHGGLDPWRTLHDLVYHPVLMRALELYYTVGWMTLLVGTLILIAAAPAFDRTRNRFMILFVLILAGLGNGLAYATLSAGPILYDHVTGDIARYEGLLRDIEVGEGLTLSRASLRDYLWTLHTTGAHDVGTGISAFPSVHLATSTLVALALSEAYPRCRVLVWLNVVAVQLCSVVLGWHYAVDGYVSIIAVVAANALLRRLAKTEGEFPAGSAQTR